MRFLKQIDRETPKSLELHLIADNYATHKHPKVKAWLAKRPRFNMHFTPTSSSWLNLVERFFADLTEDVIRSGSFASVKELVDDINAYLTERNANPQPYKWTAKGEATQCLEVSLDRMNPIQVYLSMPRRMLQRHEHLLSPPMPASHIILHNRDAACAASRYAAASSDATCRPRECHRSRE